MNPKKIRGWISRVLLIVLFISACGPSQVDLDATSTQAVVKDETTEELEYKPTSTSSPDRKIPLILSHDGAPDDIATLVYITKHPDIDLLGVVNSYGEQHPSRSLNKWQVFLYDVINYDDAAFGLGSETSVDPEQNVFPSSWRDGADDFWGLNLPAASEKYEASNGADLIIDLVKKSPEKVTILLIGGHTDMALALKKDASIAENISEIVVMGGAFNVSGNLSEAPGYKHNKVAEWNIYVDPLAAKEVFNSGIPLSIVPLDGSDDFTISRNDNRRISESSEPALSVLSDLWEQQILWWNGDFKIWDIIASVAVTNPELFTWVNDGVDVIAEAGNTHGQTIALNNGSKITRFADETDFNKVHEAVFNVLLSTAAKPIIEQPEGKVFTETLGGKIPVIFSHGGAPCDIGALVFLTKHSNVDLIGMVLSNGEFHPTNAMDDWPVFLYDVLDYDNAAIALGTETPLDPNSHEFPADWRSGADDFWGLKLPEQVSEFDTSVGHELIIDLVNNSPQKVTIIAMGALTDIALALQQDLGIIDNISHIIIMGGAFNVRGNLDEGPEWSSNEVAEWNIYIDSLAAKIVFNSGVPLSIIPLDSTFLRIQADDIKTIKTINDPGVKYVTQMWNKQWGWENREFFIWDTVTATAITNPENFEWTYDGVDVITEPGDFQGQTIALNNGAQHTRFAEAADYRAILDQVFETFRGETPSPSTTTGGADGYVGFKVVNFINGVLGDKSIFDSCDSGVQKAAAEFGIEVKTIEAGNDLGDWQSSLENTAANEDYDLMILGSWDMYQSLQELAPLFPDKHFIIYDVPVYLFTCEKGCKNVYSFDYKVNEGAYLAGAYAGMMSETGVVGVVAGMDIPVINDFIVGYKQGAMDSGIHSDNIRVEYAYDWSNPAKGKELALAMYQQDADIILQIAGNTGDGVFQAAQEVGKYAIGADVDQALIIEDTDPDQAEAILTSILKRCDNSIYRVYRVRPYETICVKI